MKKIYFLLFGFFSLSAVAQTVITYQGQTENLSGGSYQMAAPTHEAFDVPFVITNNTGSMQRWRVTRNRISVPTGWTDGLCWGHITDPFGGTCYSSGQMPGNPWTTPSGSGATFRLSTCLSTLIMLQLPPWLSQLLRL